MLTNTAFFLQKTKKTNKNFYKKKNTMVWKTILFKIIMEHFLSNKRYQIIIKSQNYNGTMVSILGYHTIIVTIGFFCKCTFLLLSGANTQTNIAT